MKYGGLNILLVEDSSINQHITNELLSKKGARVILADNGREALTKLQSTKIDYIIMDISMPIMDGYEAIKYIKSEMGTVRANIPILALTGYDIEKVSDEKRNLIKGNYLAKPFDAEELFDRIDLGLKLNMKIEKVKNADNHRKEVTPAINLSNLLKMTGNNLELVGDTLENLKKNLPRDLEILKKAFESHDLKTLSTYAHKMSPNMMLLGRKDLSVDLKSIENHVDSNTSFDEISPLVENITAQSSELMKELSIEIIRIREA